MESVDLHGLVSVQPRAVRNGTRGVNDPAAVNLTQVILHGARLQSQLGEPFMDSDAEVAAIANYVTGRFGARAATITPDQVAGRREKE